MWCSQNLPLRSFTISSKGRSLLVRKTRTGRGGGLWWSFAAAPLRAMELITILNRCHRFPGFVYQHAHLGADKKSIEVAVRPRKGSTAVCSRCGSALPVARSASLQPEDRTRLPSEGSLSAALGLQLARVGQKIPR